MIWASQNPNSQFGGIEVPAGSTTKMAPGWSGYTGDYTTQKYGDHDKPLWGSTNPKGMDSPHHLILGHFGTYYGMSLQVALPGTKLRKNKGRQHNFRELCEHSPCFSKFGIFYLHVAFWQPSCKGKTNGSLGEFRYNSPNCSSVGFLFKASTSLLPWWCGTPKEFFCCSPHGLNLKVESCSHTHVYIYMYIFSYFYNYHIYIIFLKVWPGLTKWGSIWHDTMFTMAYQVATLGWYSFGIGLLFGSTLRFLYRHLVLSRIFRTKQHRCQRASNHWWQFSLNSRVSVNVSSHNGHDLSIQQSPVMVNFVWCLGILPLWKGWLLGVWRIASH